jgi:hypothetical protein
MILETYRVAAPVEARFGQESVLLYLDPRRLHVVFAPGVAVAGPVVPRAYALTHSDSTGELFLTIGIS